ncbi:MAG: hypothetical protein K6T90_09785 [Leptolyngbyaceae cyanobacterium HOT.MB2.61]|nr:hypothetical protein [Leptolyngbyaceae cyanobacterium HOT.MB2.61]
MIEFAVLETYYVMLVALVSIGFAQIVVGKCQIYLLQLKVNSCALVDWGMLMARDRAQHTLRDCAQVM